jgi:hypothetical protein
MYKEPNGHLPRKRDEWTGERVRGRDDHDRDRPERQDFAAACRQVD